MTQGSLRFAQQPSRSRGIDDRPLTRTLSEVDPDRWLVEVFWAPCEETTIEQVVPATGGCASSELAGGHALVRSVGRCFNARPPGIHPAYGYSERTRVRSVFGQGDDGPEAACKLQYTGWFALSSAESRP